ncbi:apolipoprotein D-like [Mizuhopecten yessoensis]|uniref:Apolipoprotein D n=1 Tax=Mizuhopecten yessoensis TaxID=6573 RepID=A0A210QCB7_MIZYE|nr:apolipoprotein D-like [Mizuhopecten yessoensis]OWF46397.1 Apolipoprotein D [Mizuhopecten yessoensis]
MEQNMAVQLQVLFILGMASYVMTAINFLIKFPDLMNQGPGCPKIPAIKDFNPEQYAGTWYEIQKLNNTLQINSKCVSYTQSATRNGSFDVDYRRIITLLGKNFDITTSGKFTRIDKKRPNLFSVVIKKLEMVNYYILETDYNNYSIAYTCSKMFGFPRIEMAWLLSRSKQNMISESEMANLYSKMTNLGIDASKFTESSQDSCEADFTI